MSGRPRALALFPRLGAWRGCRPMAIAPRAALAARIPTRTAPRDFVDYIEVLPRDPLLTKTRKSGKNGKSLTRLIVYNPEGRPHMRLDDRGTCVSAPRQAGGAGTVYYLCGQADRMSQGGGGERTVPPRAAREASWTFCEMGYSVMNVAGGREDSRYMAPTARILIVEDDAIVARDLKSSLTKMGYFVTDIASSGGEALDLVATNRPNLVLMDIIVRRRSRRHRDRSAITRPVRYPGDLSHRLWRRRHLCPR